MIDGFVSFLKRLSKFVSPGSLTTLCLCFFVFDCLGQNLHSFLLPSPFLQEQSPYEDDEDSFRLHLSAEAGAGYFQTEEEGQWPEGSFRVDEAKLFVEAAIVEDIYIFSEINLITREDPDDKLHLGELFVEFENVSRLWDQDRVLNVRVGRFDVPFGEEYLTRDAIDNPFISHSLNDVWGVDEGIEFYGSFAQLDYIVGVQNGSAPIANDYHSDKAVIGKLTYRLSPSIRLTASGMRTGKLDVAEDRFSEVYFGGAPVRSIGSSDTTSTFHANLFQGDAHAAWSTGNAHVAAGRFHYDDNETSVENERDAAYFQMEAVQNLHQKNENVWYAGARFSRITSDEGLLLVGYGDYPFYFLDNRAFTTELWRLSLTAGYRVMSKVLVKVEYTIEKGTLLNDYERDQENFFGFAAAVKF